MGSSALGLLKLGEVSFISGAMCSAEPEHPSRPIAGEGLGASWDWNSDLVTSACAGGVAVLTNSTQGKK